MQNNNKNTQKLYKTFRSEDRLSKENWFKNIQQMADE